MVTGRQKCQQRQINSRSLKEFTLYAQFNSNFAQDSSRWMNRIACHCADLGKNTRSTKREQLGAQKKIIWVEEKQVGNTHRRCSFDNIQPITWQHTLQTEPTGPWYEPQHPNCTNISTHKPAELTTWQFSQIQIQQWQQFPNPFQQPQQVLNSK